MREVSTICRILNQGCGRDVRERGVLGEEIGRRLDNDGMLILNEESSVLVVYPEKA